MRSPYIYLNIFLLFSSYCIGTCSYCHDQAERGVVDSDSPSEERMLRGKLPFESRQVWGTRCTPLHLARSCWSGRRLLAKLGIQIPSQASTPRCLLQWISIEITKVVPVLPATSVDEYQKVVGPALALLFSLFLMQRKLSACG